MANRFANPVLRRLLRGRLGAVLGRRLAVVRYAGRRTGAPRELVVQYRREGDRVVIVPSRPQDKRWWRNFAEPHPVELWLAGRRVAGTGRVVGGDDGPVTVVVEPAA